MTKGTERWDVVIDPTRPWWRLDLKEIWRYRDLLVLLVRRDLLAVYKQTDLGPIWQVLQPVLTALMFAAIHEMMGRMAPPGIPPLLFYLSGLVPWTFFANIINRTSQTLVWNQALMTKVYFPRLVAPMATTASTMVSFLIQLATFFLFAVGYRIFSDYAWTVHANLAMVPVLVLLLAVLGFGTGLLVAALTTKFRDFTFLVGFAVQLLMYMSPVIFPLSRAVPGSTTRLVIEMNPMTPVIEGFRSALVGSPMEWGTLYYTLVVATIMLVVGLSYFQKVERSFAD
ncbi:MAG TPA: ABC transporter permease, partial [Flavobacteriales bacterium]|nr:ABC transporter permease [Flavobacteriales bacterium]